MSLANNLSFIVSPLLFLLLGAYMHYKFSIRSYKNLRNAVLLGALAIVVLLASNYLIEFRWNGNYRNMRRMAFFVFITTAFAAELGKFIVLRAHFYKLKTFIGPLEGIVYSLFIGLGFSTLAVIGYDLGWLGVPDQIHNFTLFLYTYPLATMVISICMGFFVGQGKLRKNGFIDNSTALFVATFFHGLYYFGFITSDIRLLVFIAIGFLVISVTLILKAATLTEQHKKP